MSVPLRIILQTLLLLFSGIAVASDNFVDELPAKSEVIPDFSRTQLQARLSEMALHHIEGIWMFTGTGTTIAIERVYRNERAYSTSFTGYSIVVVSSPNRALRPGTIMGYVSPSAKDGVYDARVYTKSIGSTLILPRRFTLKIDGNESRLAFQQRKSAYGFNILRMLPYLWRSPIYRNHQSETSEGCVRIYPEPVPPIEPRYL